ncbi:hypothetical protein BV898_04226 [Hypsibius exemplaris]|uniref:Receptor ligand binding region domain-containing protein n=1 Tax=Hypsibius exemplaris TaxID=2072580 RepID=A0A1W0X3F0_HYPEX|nr:hypothetical protein BV898_04226 [Hypsibius exemplaris]
MVLFCSILLVLPLLQTLLAKQSQRLMESHSVFNVTALIYVITDMPLLQSLPYTGPGYDLGARDVNVQFKDDFNIHHQYVSSSRGTIKTCLDLGANYDSVVSLYHREKERGNNIVLFFGGCDETTILPSLAREWDVLLLLTGTIFSTARDRELYPTTVALGSIQYQSFADMAVQLLKKYNWISSSFSYDLTSSTFYIMMGKYISRNARQASLDGLQMYFFPISSAVGIDYEKTLQEMAAVSRVVFFAVLPATMRRFMHSANRLGFTRTQEFVWIYIELPEAPSGTYQWIPNDNATSLEWFSTSFLLSPCYGYEPDTEPTLVAEMRERSLHDYNMTFPPNRGPSEMAIDAYRSMKILAEILNEIIDQRKDLTSGQVLAQQLLNRTVLAKGFGDRYIDASGERQNRMCLLGFQQTKKQFVVVEYYGGSPDASSQAPHNITWSTPDGTPPPNEPWCGFLGDRLRCRTSRDTLLFSTLLPAVVLALAIVGSSVAAALYRRVNTSNADTSWWLLDSPELEADRIELSLSSNWSSNKVTFN